MFKKALATSAVFASLVVAIPEGEVHATPIFNAMYSGSSEGICDLSGQTLCGTVEPQQGYQIAPQLLIIQEYDDEGNPFPQVDILAEEGKYYIDDISGSSSSFLNFVSPVQASELDAQDLSVTTGDFDSLSINGVSVQGQIDSNEQAIDSNEQAINTNIKAINTNKKAINTNKKAINTNKKAINTNIKAINTNIKAINTNKKAINTNTKAIDTNRTNINNLGDGIAASTALGAALSALPVTPDDAPFSCGIGSGAYSSRFAMGLGCVAKLNQRLSINAGGSYVFGGSRSYGGGELDTLAMRGGFVIKLGTIKSPAIANQQLQSQLSKLKLENAEITQQNKSLIARLERLEAIAFGPQPATTTVSLK